MSDLPNLGEVVTGGIVGTVIIAARWLLAWYRRAADDGETLAARRIADLTAEFEAHRRRTELTMKATDAEVLALRSELEDYRVELQAAREQLRQCRAESHQTQMQLDDLMTELARLRQS